jgi:hypothetical protein
MANFNKQDVLNACAQYGPSLTVPAGLDPIKVMAAIASNESSFGKNCGPRHEPAYEAGGAVWARKAMAPLLVQYPPTGDPPQSPAACSYGPWQMMFLNFQRIYAPSFLSNSLETCAAEFVRWFNDYVVGKHPQSLVEIGEIWNAGHITPDLAYTNKLEVAYKSM